MHVCVCICMYVRMYVCVCIYMYVCVCVCIYMYVCMCVCVYICMYVYMCVCIYMYICVCVYICIYKAGESNSKLPLRTCPGCSVPEPFQSHDWALLNANPASKAEY